MENALDVGPCLAGGNLVIDGDSIAVGQGSDLGQTLAAQISSMISIDYLHVVGKSGRPVSQCLKLYDQNVASLFEVSSHPNVIFFHAGDNDVSLGSDGDATYELLEEYVRKAHSQGWKVVTSTELPRYDMPAAKRAAVDRYNDLVRLNSVGADAVADFAADPIMGGRETRADPIYYTKDGIHPANAGYTILAKIAVAKLSTYFASKP